MMKNYIKRFALKDIIEAIKNAQYAVRGPIVSKAQDYKLQLDRGNQNKLPFDTISFLNIGNPQQLGQPPIQYNREVLSCLMNKELIDKNVYHSDISKRAKNYFSKFTSLGQYSESAGFRFVRESVAKFIEKRDGYPSDADDLFLLNGAGDGARLSMQVLINGPETGIMIPVPRYPLYSAEITLKNGTIVPYYLDEYNNWQLKISELEKQYKESMNKGVTPKCLVVINPGNPTGQVLSGENIKDIIKFCYANSLAIIADEVYQYNIYHEEKKFQSFKKVLMDLGEPYSEGLELISLHSISKGIQGECGFRGGYMEMVNICPKVRQEMLKLQSIVLCSSTLGQLAMELMVNPPTIENSSQETVDKYNGQCKELFNSLKKRAQFLSSSLQKMKNITCNEIEGAMYAFPQIKFSAKAIKAAKEQGMEVDELYCFKLLDETGIVVVPGTGFGQEPETYHFRITILLPEAALEQSMKKLSDFNDKFHAMYQ